MKKPKHQLPGRFVEVSCATLRGDSAMSTLFSHVQGASTGATSDRAGLLRSAHQGLLFLDEIGELGLGEQTTLLRALEGKRFFPAGGDREVESDFHIPGALRTRLGSSSTTSELRRTCGPDVTSPPPNRKIRSGMFWRKLSINCLFLRA
ncbi:sigma 54-interacting transcriptional regulator [Frateuria hangzhouensis]|uniref:sigma 54-interacting transcriptional regulator n=1 Tax=Frateuria hangzhouensis TaxID=2995589 RepID=UPI002B1EBDE4|nr:sigma 54-interacting transcriptional regulator [Frateuria sp. STR12]